MESSQSNGQNSNQNNASPPAEGRDIGTAITRIETPRGSIILLGTAHVSQNSVREVEEAIRNENPSVVAVELDASRYKTLNDTQQWKNLNIAQVIKENKVFLLLTSLVLSAYQKRLGLKLETRPGDEMRAAIRTAGDLGIPLSTIDRDISLTLRRAWRKTGFVGRVKLLSVLAGSAFSREELSEQDIEKLKQGSALDDMMKEMAGFLPSVKTVLIDERDEFLALKIWEEMAKAEQKNERGEFAGDSGSGQSEAIAPPLKLLAVVGAGHVPGMAEHIRSLSESASGRESTAGQAGEQANKPKRENSAVPEISPNPKSTELRTRIAELSQIPRAGIAGKIIPWLIVLAILIIFILGFVFNGLEGGLRRILYWFLINGSLSALGSIVALAHPLTILASVIAAPITSMNPTIGVGVVTGLSEFFLRKPRVQDFETLSDDAVNISGFYKNRITRILLVFIFSSIGSAVGTFIALPLIFP